MAHGHGQLRRGPRVSHSASAELGTERDRGGAVWGIGTVFNFVGASLVGVAISYAIGQASPMIAALWGVFVWREFRGSNSAAKLYLVGMFVAYVLALVLIARAHQAD